LNGAELEKKPEKRVVSPGSEIGRRNSMTKQQIIKEAEEWLRAPNRVVELYKRGEPAFEVDATSQESLARFESVLMPIPDLALLALVNLKATDLRFVW
jgi:hypothetical protein